MDYLARTSYMLQQGRFQADVAYFYGEESPLTGLYGETVVADAPEHYGYDFVNADIVLNLLSVKDGWLTTPSGMRYRALQLGGSSSRMTLPVLRKIAALVDARRGGRRRTANGVTEPVGRSAGVRADCRSRLGLWQGHGTAD